MKYFSTLIFLILFCVTICFSNEDISYQTCIQKAFEAQSLYQMKDAEHWFRKALEIKDTDPTIRLALARTLFAQLKNKEAIGQVEMVLEDHPNHAEAHYFLCRYYWKIEHDIDNAAKFGELAAQYDPQHIGARTLLGEIYISQRKYNKAEEIYHELIKIDDTSTDAHIGLGNALIKQEKYDQGVNSLNQAAQINPKDPEPHRILATAHAMNGNREKAKEEQKIFQQLENRLQQIENLLMDLHKEPENAPLWFELGKEYLRQRYPTEKAIEALKKGLQFEKENADMHNLLGTLYLNTNQTTLAKDHLLFSITINPDNPKFYNNLGVACLLSEEYKEAVKYLKKSLDLGNDDPGVIRNLEFAKIKLEEISKK